MKTKLLRAILPLAIVFTLISCSPETAEDRSADKKIVTNYNYNETELKLVTMINNYRESRGLNALEVINHISYKSEEHNLYMIQNRVVNHDGFQHRSDNLIELLGADRVGENVAYNFNTAESAFSAWMNSSGHRANIEGNYTHFGISVTVDSQTGKKYYTNLFMKRK